MFIVPDPGPACGGTYSHDWLNRKQSPFYTKKRYVPAKERMVTTEAMMTNSGIVRTKVFKVTFFISAATI
jgi:hypothetical protein